MVRISYPSPRVSQLDAQILDSELLSLLKQELANIFQHHTGSSWTFNHHPELWTLALNLAIFRLTTWRTGSSYGLSLQNLKLANFTDGKLISYNKRMLLCAVLIGDYGFLKLQSYLYSKDETDTYSLRLLQFIVKHRDAVLTKINQAFKILNLVNFVLFLVNGKFPSVVHRVLGIAMTPVSSDLLKFNGSNVNFEFQNRQLVWNVLTEFLVFILPLLKLKSLRRKFNKLVAPSAKKSSHTDQDDERNTAYTNLSVSQCAICIEGSLSGPKLSGTAGNGSYPVTNAYITNCGHIYCYVCIATRFNYMEVSEGDCDNCPRCNETLTSFSEYNDIDDSAIVVELEDVGEEEVNEHNKREEDDDDEEEEDDEEDEEEDEEDDYSDGEDIDLDEAFDL